jgi:hypothetical protein
MKITLTLPPTLATRVKRRADMRGVSVEDYLVLLADWNSPAYDNDAQWLREQIKGAVGSNRTDDYAAVEAVAKLVE